MANATNSGKLNELTKEKEEAEALLEEKNGPLGLPERSCGKNRSPEQKINFCRR